MFEMYVRLMSKENGNISNSYNADVISDAYKNNEKIEDFDLNSEDTVITEIECSKLFIELSRLALDVEDFIDRYEELLDEVDINKIKSIVEVEGGDFVMCNSSFSLDNYYYYDSITIEELAEDIMRDCYMTKENEWLFDKGYINYKSFADDLLYDNFYVTTWGILEVIY